MKANKTILHAKSSHSSIHCLTTYARCGVIFNNYFTANLPGNLRVEKCENRLRLDRLMAVSLWLSFFRPPCR